MMRRGAAALSLLVVLAAATTVLACGQCKTGNCPGSCSFPRACNGVCGIYCMCDGIASDHPVPVLHGVSKTGPGTFTWTNATSTAAENVDQGDWILWYDDPVQVTEMWAAPPSPMFPTKLEAGVSLMLPTNNTAPG